MARPINQFIEKLAEPSVFVLVIGTKLYLEKCKRTFGDINIPTHVVRFEGQLIDSKLRHNALQMERVLPVLLEGSMRESFSPLIETLGQIPCDFTKGDYFGTVLRLAQNLCRIDNQNVGLQALLKDLEIRTKSIDERISALMQRAYRERKIKEKLDLQTQRALKDAIGSISPEHSPRHYALSEKSKQEDAAARIETGLAFRSRDNFPDSSSPVISHPLSASSPSGGWSLEQGREPAFKSKDTMKGLELEAKTEEVTFINTAACNSPRTKTPLERLPQSALEHDVLHLTPVSANIPSEAQATLAIGSSVSSTGNSQSLQKSHQEEGALLVNQFSSPPVPTSQLDVFELERRAKQGAVEAMRELGIRYHLGMGVKEDKEKSSQRFIQAAKEGDEYSKGRCFGFGYGVTKNHSQAAACYRRAAEGGYAPAQSALAWCHQNGEGIEKDEKRAVDLYQRAAHQGFAPAQSNLGWCYENGKGIAKDEHLAVEWYRKAAEQGHADAQRNLGLCYENGKGIAKDERLAVEWYRKAAEQGHSGAVAALERLLSSQLPARTSTNANASVTVAAEQVSSDSRGASGLSAPKFGNGCRIA